MRNQTGQEPLTLLQELACSSANLNEPGPRRKIDNRSKIKNTFQRIGMQGLEGRTRPVPSVVVVARRRRLQQLTCTDFQVEMPVLVYFPKEGHC